MGATPTADKPLTDRLLRSWVRCRRRAWLDRHADPKDRLYTAHRTLQLDDQQRSFMALLPGKPGHGLKACERGDAGVVGLRLRGFLQNGSLLEGVALEAHPPLLQRVKGSSHWGGFAYRPVIARQGRRLTREHRLPLALAGRLLATFQSSEVPEALAVARSGRGLELERLPLGISLHRQLDESLLRLLRDLKRVDPPPLPPIDANACFAAGGGYAMTLLLSRGISVKSVGLAPKGVRCFTKLVLIAFMPWRQLIPRSSEASSSASASSMQRWVHLWCLRPVSSVTV